MSEKDIATLLAILEACVKIQNFVKNIDDADAFYADEKTFDAVLMNFVVIGESVLRLTDNTKQSNSKIPWTKYKGFRNIVVHNYFGVNAEEDWQIVGTSIPVLKVEIESLL